LKLDAIGHDGRRFDRRLIHCEPSRLPPFTYFFRSVGRLRFRGSSS
jgi:hypothetical protein